MNSFHEMNKASTILAKIGSGSADADFARAIENAVERAQQTEKKCKVVMTVEVEPSTETGSLVMRCEVVEKLAKLPAPASQMHVGAGGELLTQMEFLVGGGRSEVSTVKPVPLPNEQKSASGRHPIASVPPRAPLASAPPRPPLHDGGPRPTTTAESTENTGTEAGEQEA